MAIMVQTSETLVRYTCHLLALFVHANDVSWQPPAGFIVQAELAAEAAVVGMMLLHRAIMVVCLTARRLCPCDAPADPQHKQGGRGGRSARFFSCAGFQLQHTFWLGPTSLIIVTEVHKAIMSLRAHWIQWRTYKAALQSLEARCDHVVD